MTENAFSAGRAVVVRRVPQGPGDPSALVAARLYAELGPLSFEVAVGDDTVSFLCQPQAAAQIHTRIAAALLQEQFAGWALSQE